MALFVIFRDIPFVNYQLTVTAQRIIFAILFPLFGVAVLMLLSIGIFPFKYSIFGPYERASFPDEKPLYIRLRSYGKIGQLRGTKPLFSWYIFTSGLGISILGIGKIFISKEYIKDVYVNTTFGNHRNFELIHNSPQIRNPIYLPDQEFSQKLLDTISNN